MLSKLGKRIAYLTSINVFVGPPGYKTEHVPARLFVIQNAQGQIHTAVSVGKTTLKTVLSSYFINPDRK